MCREDGVASRVANWLATHRPHISDFGLTDNDVAHFIRSEWSIPQPVFIAYRVFIACYTLAWLIMSIVNAGLTTGLAGFFVFLTNWTFIVLTLYLLTACVSTVYASCQWDQSLPSDVNYTNNVSTITEPEPNSTTNSTPSLEYGPVPFRNSTMHQLPVYFKITWALLYVCLTFNPIISVIYWAFIFNPAFVYAQQGGAYGVALTVHRHALNTVIAYFDLSISATPVRFWHFVYPCLYGVVYIVFSLIYYWAGGLNPYREGVPAIYPKLLDWTIPGRTTLAIIAFVFVLVVFHSCAFGFYKLRMFLANKFHGVPFCGLQCARTNSQRVQNNLEYVDELSNSTNVV